MQGSLLRSDPRPGWMLFFRTVLSAFAVVRAWVGLVLVCESWLSGMPACNLAPKYSCHQSCFLERTFAAFRRLSATACSACNLAGKTAVAELRSTPQLDPEISHPGPAMF